MSKLGSFFMPGAATEERARIRRSRALSKEMEKSEEPSTYSPLKSSRIVDTKELTERLFSHKPKERSRKNVEPQFVKNSYLNKSVSIGGHKRYMSNHVYIPAAKPG